MKNIGERKAAEVVQLYIRDDFASVARPVRELKGFKKVTLEPGSEQEVTFEITEDMLKFTGADDAFKAEKGSFTVYVGNSSETENSATFELV